MIKVGIIGCGWFGNVHLDNLLKMDGVSVEALTSSNKQKLDSTGKKAPNARLYENHTDMISNEKLDAIIVCVTPERHSDIEILAAKNNIHMYIEKPIEVSMDRAIENLKAIENAGIITSVGYQERYNEALDKVRDAIKGKKVRLVVGKWIDSIPGVPWWRVRAKSGGQVVEQTTHIIDALRYVLGEGKTVFAKGISTDEYDVEECSSTLIEFDCGAVASILSGCFINSSKSLSDTGFIIYTDEMQITYQWGRSVSFESKKETCTLDIAQNSHCISLQTFINAVKNNDSSAIKSPYSDSIKTFKLTTDADNWLC